MRYLLLGVFLFVFQNIVKGNSNCDDALFIKNKLNQTGAGYSRMHNDFLSPNTHEGVAFHLNTLSFREHKNTYLQSNLHGDISRGNNQVNEAYLFTYTLNYRYLYTWRLKGKREALSLFIGPSANTGIIFYNKIQNQNNPFSYRYTNTFDLAFLADLRFNFGKIYIGINNQLFIPLVGVVAGSEYASGVPLGFFESEESILPSLQIRNITKHYGFTNVISFDFAVGNKDSFFSSSRWRISYYFSGSSEKINNINHSNAFHAIMVGRIIKLYRYKE